MEQILQDLQNKIEELENRISKLEKKKQKQLGPSEGSFVWDEYERLYLLRYKIKPLRNAVTNRHCKTLVDRLGKDGAIEVVQYYLYTSDYFYVNKTHDLSLCVRDCSTLYTRAKSGKHITPAQARESELAHSNKEAMNQYVTSKQPRD